MSILSYKIANIQVVDFNCLTTLVSDERVRVMSRFNFLINASEKRILCESSYAYMQGEKELLHMTLNCIFQMEEESFESLKKDNGYVVPVDYLRYMATICVGTARGEIHSRAEYAKSDLKEIVLPPIDLTKIISTEAVFKV